MIALSKRYNRSLRVQQRPTPLDIIEISDEENAANPGFMWPPVNGSFAPNTDDQPTPPRPRHGSANSPTPPQIMSPGSSIIILDEDSLSSVTSHESLPAPIMSPGSSIITLEEESLPEMIPTSIVSQSEASSAEDNSQGNEIVSDLEVREGTDNGYQAELSTSPRYADWTESEAEESGSSSDGDPRRMRSVVVVPDGRNSWCRFSCREEFSSEVQVGLQRHIRMGMALRVPRKQYKRIVEVCGRSYRLLINRQGKVFVKSR